MQRTMIDPFLVYLTKNEPFYASISRKVIKEETDQIPTAAVGFNEDQNLYLAYNPEFIKDLSFKEVIGVLKHEFLHIVFLHLTDKRMAGFKNEDQHERFNVAADLAINSFIEDELPDVGVFAGSEKGSEQFSDWPKNKSAEYYLNRIRQEYDDENEEEDGEGELDGDALDQHDWYGDDMSDAERSIAEEKMKQAVERGRKEAAKENDWGTVPQEIRDKIRAKLSGGTVDWRKLLRQFVTQISTNERLSSVRQVNNKYPYIHPGHRREKRPNIAVSVDQSGSISNENLSTVATELNKLAELVEFTVIPFDTDFSEDDIFEWQRGEKFTEIERVRGGGTDLDPATEYVNNHGFQGHIMFTDMEAVEPKKSQCPRIYLVPEDGHPRFEPTRDRMIRLSSNPQK